MSVVNKMLKDLEARGGDDKPHANYQPPVKKSRRLRLWVYGLTTVAIVVIGMAILTMPGKVSTPPSAVSDTPLATSDNAPRATTAQTIEQPSASMEEKSAPVADAESVSEAIASQSHQSDTPGDTTGSERAQAPTGQVVPPSTGSMRAVPVMVVEADSNQENLTEATEPESRFELTSAAGGNQQTQNLREQIRLALAKPDKREAVSLMGRLIDAEPENVAVRKKLAAILFSQGQVNSARDMLITTLGMSPADHSVRLMLARLYTQQGQPEAAAAVMADADSYRPLSVDLLAFRAAAAQERGDYTASLSDYNRLAAMSPEQARWWLGVGTSADKLGEREVARRAYQQALSLRQLSREVHQFITQRLSALSGGNNE